MSSQGAQTLGRRKRWGHPSLIANQKFGCYYFCCQDHGFEVD